MGIRKAILSDKNPILDFCQSTFSWGDYISDVWDFWFKEGILLVTSVNEKPVALCHGLVVDGNCLWIEGIRVHPEFRRKGIAKDLVIETENFGKKENCTTSMMLIESNNTKSLKLAELLGYKQIEKWNFFTLSSQKINDETPLEYVQDFSELEKFYSEKNYFVKSWRWIPWSKQLLSTLIKSNQIVYSKSSGINQGVAILADSEHFEKTILVTMPFGTKDGLKEITNKLTNTLLSKNYKRIQIITKQNDFSGIQGIEDRFSFYLVKKAL